MPDASFVGQMTTGHNGYPPTDYITGDNGVMINGQPISVVGSTATPHAKPSYPPHPVVAAGGSGTVKVNGVPVHRNADPLACGDTCDASSHVKVGG